MTANGTSSGPAACLLTPAASGGIAVIEVRGTGAAALVSRFFRPRRKGDWTADTPGHLYYGHIVDGGERIDEVIVRHRSSRMGGEAVEVNCHGGVVAAGEIMRLFEQGGAREMPAEAFVREASRDMGLDAVRTEALERLPSAQTKLAARMLCDQLNGALSQAVARLAENPNRSTVNDLLRSAEFGRALLEPRCVALLGRPNVGKSTLFNALVGHHRTIVSATPGTTRDYVDETIALGGYPVELIDTAGLWQTDGPVEARGVEAAREVGRRAGIVVLVLDGSRPLLPDEVRAAHELADRDAIAVLNKADLSSKADPAPLPADLPRCTLSASTGEGLKELEAEIRRLLPQPDPYPPGSPVVFTGRQYSGLDRAAKLLEAGHTDSARDMLLGLLRPPSES